MWPLVKAELGYQKPILVAAMGAVLAILIFLWFSPVLFFIPEIPFPRRISITFWFLFWVSFVILMNTIFPPQGIYRREHRNRLLALLPVPLWQLGILRFLLMISAWAALIRDFPSVPALRRRLGPLLGRPCLAPDAGFAERRVPDGLSLRRVHDRPANGLPQGQEVPAAALAALSHQLHRTRVLEAGVELLLSQACEAGESVAYPGAEVEARYLRAEGWGPVMLSPPFLAARCRVER